jgi:hypothetical protein
MGHGLAAAGVAAFALSAYRHSRRRGLGLLETYAAMDGAVGDQFPDERYVTPVIAQLDPRDRTPVVDQRGASATPGRSRRPAVRAPIIAPAAAPLGIPLDGPSPTVAQESLQPGDLLLLYTDGLTEARHPDGQMFTVPRARRVHRARSRRGQTAPKRCAGCAMPSSTGNRDS